MPPADPEIGGRRPRASTARAFREWGETEGGGRPEGARRAGSAAVGEARHGHAHGRGRLLRDARRRAGGVVVAEDAHLAEIRPDDLVLRRDPVPDELADDVEGE